MREYKHRWHYLFTMVFRDKWLSNFSLNRNFEMKQNRDDTLATEGDRMCMRVCTENKKEDDISKGRLKKCHVRRRRRRHCRCRCRYLRFSK